MGGTFRYCWPQIGNPIIWQFLLKNELIKVVRATSPLLRKCIHCQIYIQLENNSKKSKQNDSSESKKAKAVQSSWQTGEDNTNKLYSLGFS